MKDRADDFSVPARLKVADVLVNYGKDVSFSRGGLIRSPFRDERTPSFHILPPGYGWVDFGDGSRGGVIDLVMRLENCGRDGAISRLAEIRNGGKVFVPKNPHGKQHSRRSAAPSFRVVATAPFTDPSLLEYAARRGIREEILNRYCVQAQVRVRSLQHTVPYIGFPNNGGGYVLRGAEQGRDGKRCTLAAPTFLDARGEMTAEATCQRVAVFEGFFDFLSVIARHGEGPDGLECGCDVCVLNSVTNVTSALPFIRAHLNADLYLDNDAAGQKATERIRSSCPSAAITDRRDTYAAFGDYNDFHRAAPPR